MQLSGNFARSLQRAISILLLLRQLLPACHHITSPTPRIIPEHPSRLPISARTGRRRREGGGVVDAREKAGWESMNHLNN
ncbi:unnamed protein product [Lampetra planeri]